MTISKKTIALLMALVLVLGVGVGGTIAWLSTKTATVTNTFVVGEIGTLTLTESDVVNNAATTLDASTVDKTHTDFVIVPGVDLTKDPKVAFTANETTGDTANDVPVYVFVKIAAGSNWTVSGSTYTYAAPAIGNDIAAVSEALKFTVNTTANTGWTALADTPGVFYKTLEANVDLAATSIITDNKITVSKDITSEQLKALTAANFNLVFSAYAIQQQGFTGAAAAWAALNPTTTP